MSIYQLGENRSGSNSRTASFWLPSENEATAFILPDQSCVTYRALAQQTAAFRARLPAERGLVGIACDGHFRQYVAYLAALNAGHPVVLLQPGQSAESTALSLRVLYTPADDAVAQISANGQPSLHEDLALLLSTSGSTGATKWVRLSHRNIAANAASIADYLELSPEDRAPMALPFQYSYGMSVLNSHLAVGASIVLTEGSVTEPEFWRTFEQTGCTSLAGVPHSFDLMDQARMRTDHLKALRYMTQAGGRMAPSRVRDWSERARAEGWRFFVMYGQTEASPRISYLPPDLAFESPGAIGVPVPGGDMWVGDETGERLPDGAEGELIYCGPNTMMGYAENDADLGKDSGSDILATGDIARRLPNGVFEIVGRKSRFVKLFGLRISLDEVERHLQRRGISATCGAHGDRVYVFVARDSGRSVQPDEVRNDLAAWLKLPGDSFHVDMIDAIPRNANGKVDHPALAARIKEIETSKAAMRQGQPAFRSLLGRFCKRRGTVLQVFQAQFGDNRVTPGSSFTDLGGDSLSYLAVSLELESVVGDLPENWGDMTVAELQSIAGSRGAIAFIDTPTLIRAMAIMLVVAGHFEVFDYGGGGARTLLVVAGMSFAAFTLPQILKDDRIMPILSLFSRVAALTFGYLFLKFAGSGGSYGEWSAFLFIGNWVVRSGEGSAWFVEVYLQCLLLLLIVFSFAAFRDAIRRRPFQVAVVAAGAFVLVAAIADALVDTHHLARRLPHLLMWMFMVGVAAAHARTIGERSLVSIVCLAGYWQFLGYGLLSVGFFPLAFMILIWLPAMPVPRLLQRPLRMIAGASLMIYLTHFQVETVVHQLLSDESAAISWLAAIAGGVVLWRLYNPVDRWIDKQLNGSFKKWDRQRGSTGYVTEP